MENVAKTDEELLNEFKLNQEKNNELMNSLVGEEVEKLSNIDDNFTGIKSLKEINDTLTSSIHDAFKAKFNQLKANNKQLANDVKKSNKQLVNSAFSFIEQSLNLDNKETIKILDTFKWYYTGSLYLVTSSLTYSNITYLMSNAKFYPKSSVNIVFNVNFTVDTSKDFKSRVKLIKTVVNMCKNDISINEIALFSKLAGIVDCNIMNETFKINFATFMSMDVKSINEIVTKIYSNKLSMINNNDYLSGLVADKMNREVETSAETVK